jgi:hypothetical protein
MQSPLIKQAPQAPGQEEHGVDTGAFFIDNAPSWGELAEMVEKRMQETGGRRPWQSCMQYLRFMHLVSNKAYMHGPVCHGSQFCMLQVTSIWTLTRRMGQPMRGRCGACLGSRGRPSSSFTGTAQHGALTARR